MLILILDEPSSNLDPKERYNIKNLIVELSKQNITILFTSHDLYEVEDLASRIIFFDKGRIVANGSVNELLETYNSKSLEELYIKLID